MSNDRSACKLCFVTVGATANFDALIRASASPVFLQALAKHGYTDLLLQYGKDGDKLLEQLIPRDLAGQADGSDDVFRVANGIRIAGFDFKSEGLGAEMLAARGSSLGFQREGVVISHAGNNLLFHNNTSRYAMAYSTHQHRATSSRET